MGGLEDCSTGFPHAMTCNVIACGGCHDFLTIWERAEGISNITRNPTGRGEPNTQNFVGIFVCMCALLHCLMLVGVFMNRPLESFH